MGNPTGAIRLTSLAFTAEARNENLLFHVSLNAYWEPLEFELPRPGEQTENAWGRWIDTDLDSSHDIADWETAPLIPGRTYSSHPHSLVVLFAKVVPKEPTNFRRLHEV